MDDKGWSVHSCVICQLPCDCGAYSQAGCSSCDTCSEPSEWDDDDDDWDDDDD